MSFLLDRAYNILDNATRDPAAEANKKKEQDTIYELTKTYRQQLINDKNEILAMGEKKAYSDYDLEILNELNSLRATILDNKSGLTSDQFSRKWIENTDKYKIITSYNINIRQSGMYRKGIYQLLGKSIKQCLRDSKLSDENKEYLKNVQEDLLKVLSENTYTESEVIFVNEFNRLSNRLFAENPGTNALMEAAKTKVIKNSFNLDFQEPGGPTVPDAVLKAKAQEDAEKADAKQDTFSLTRVFKKSLSHAYNIFTILFIIFLLCIGASFAVNLNIYKPVPFRILYAIYGFIFAIVVIPYTLLYRWIYLGKAPRYYGFIPLISRYFVHKPIQFLFGWLTYRPDDHMWDLEEWRNRPT